MTFVITDRDQTLEALGLSELVEFDTLKEFAEWAVSVGLPRFEFVPPNTNTSNRLTKNRTNHWMLYLTSDYD
jgi:hypothetical protein